MLFDNDESNHAVLIKRQHCANLAIDSHEYFPYLATGSTVVVQHKEGGSWMYVIIVWHGSDDNDR